MSNDVVRQLLDVEAIKKLKYRYFRALDAQDWDRFIHLMTDDVEVYFAFPDEQFVPGDAVRTPEGWARLDRDGLLRWLKTVSEGFTTVHHAHMPDITITSADTATGRWSMTDYTRWDAAGDPTWYRAYGDYEDEYVRMSDGWRIRRSVFGRHEIDSFAEARPAPNPE